MMGARCQIITIRTLRTSHRYHIKMMNGIKLVCLLFSLIALGFCGVSEMFGSNYASERNDL